MVTFETLVAHYLRALRHWEGQTRVRALGATVGLNRRMYCEFFAARHLNATTWTSGSGLNGNAAYDEALRRLATPESTVPVYLTAPDVAAEAAG